MPIEDLTHSAKPQFNAINGEELRYLILRELDNKLKDYDEFKAHLAYSKFMYLVEVQVAVDAYPQSKTVSATVLAEGKSPGYEPAAGAAPRKFSMSWGSKTPVTKPDELRKEAGIPVPKTTPTADGQIVDKLVEQVAPVPDYLKEGVR
jgi:hypothetical protein